MTLAILTFASALVPLLVWWLKRRSERQSDPAEQHKQRYEQIDTAIARDDERAANADLHADLDELERLERLRHAREGDQRGPDANAGEGR